MHRTTPWLASLVALCLLTTPTASWAEATAATVALVTFSSGESQKRLSRSRHKADFFRLANHFETQQNLGNCGPTSAVIVLNALRVDDAAVEKPTDATAFPAEYRASLPPSLQPVAARYTQHLFIDARFEKVKPRAVFYGQPAADGSRDPGLQLRQLHQILLGYGLSSTLRVVDDSLSDATIEAELAKNLATDGDFVIVNYARGALGQPGGGHLSPLGAYDAASKSFLVLDVNSNKAPWVWVPAKALIAAMRTKDTVENRGYVLVREGK